MTSGLFSRETDRQTAVERGTPDPKSISFPFSLLLFISSSRQGPANDFLKGQASAQQVRRSHREAGCCCCYCRCCCCSCCCCCWVRTSPCAKNNNNWLGPRAILGVVVPPPFPTICCLCRVLLGYMRLCVLSRSFLPCAMGVHRFDFSVFESSLFYLDVSTPARVTFTRGGGCLLVDGPSSVCPCLPGLLS